MAKIIRHIAKKDLIRAELMKHIRAKPIKKAYYGELGALTGTGPRGPSKEVLDLIADEEEAAGLPDITVILVRRDTDYPGQVDRRKTEKPMQKDKARVREKFQEVIDKHNPGESNPFD